jgi:hypothetical protein
MLQGAAARPMDGADELGPCRLELCPRRHDIRDAEALENQCQRCSEHCLGGWRVAWMPIVLGHSFLRRRIRQQD